MPLVHSYRTYLLLLSIIILGAWLRFQGLNWDQGYHLQPDERYISLVLSAISPAKNWVEYFDPNRSPLSPYTHGYGSYIYGQLPLTILTYLSQWLRMVGYDSTYMLGRAISATLDTFSILLTFKVGKRLWNERVGAIGAAFYAFSPMAIQYSHFMVTESWVTFGWLLIIWQLISGEKFRKLHKVLILGILLGAAMAVKASSVVLVPLVVVGVAMAGWKKAGGLGTLGILGTLGVIGVLVILSFRFFQPTIFQSAGWLDWALRKDFLQAFNFQRLAIDGKVMFPPQWQWVGTARWWFPLKNIVFWGLGPAAGVLAMIGVIREVREIRSLLKLVLAVWVLAIFFWQGGKFVKSMRYFLPFFPMYSLFAASAIDWRKRSNLAAARLDLKTTAVASMGVTLLWAAAFTNIYRQPTTRVAASEWIYQNIPAGSSVMLEEWDDPLPLVIAGYEPSRYRTEMVQVYASDGIQKQKEIDRWINEFDWIVLSSPRAKASIGKLSDTFPLMSKFYAGLDSGELGFTKMVELTSFPKLSMNNYQLIIKDSSAEESFWVYDHPTVEIYRRKK